PEPELLTSRSRLGCSGRNRRNSGSSVIRPLIEMFTTAGDTRSIIGASDGTCWLGSWATATAGSASAADRMTHCAARPTAAKRRARAFIGVTVSEELSQAQRVRRRAVIVMGPVEKGAPGN